MTAVGLAGYGIWGRHILRDTLDLGCTVTVADPDADRRALALAAGAHAAVTDIASLDGLDGIVVATPIARHAATVAAALQHGVPVFAEKPLTDDPASAASLASVAPDRLFVMHKWRYHPGVKALASIAQSGELGVVAGVEARRLGWRNNNTIADVVWTLVPHDLTIALAILGSLPEPVAATITGTVERPLGMHAVLGTSPWLTIESAVASPSEDRRVVVRGTEADAALLGSYDDHVVVWRHDGGELADAPALERRPISTELPLRAELAAFIDHLRGGPPPIASAAEGARVVEVVARLRDLAGCRRER